MPYRIYKFGATILPPLEASHEIGTGGSKLQFVETPAGQTDLLGSDERALHAPQSLVYSCKVLDNLTTMQTTLDSYKKLRGTRALLYRVLPDNSEHTIFARLESIGGISGSRKRRLQPLTFNFSLLDQAWRGTLLSYEYKGLTTGTTPLPYPAYTGNIEQKSINILAFAGTGGFTDLKIQSTNPSGYWVRYLATVAQTKVLEIDTGLLSVTNDGVGDYNHFSHSDYFKDWLRTETGNTFQAVLTGNVSNLFLSFYELWS